MMKNDRFRDELSLLFMLAGTTELPDRRSARTWLDGIDLTREYDLVKKKKSKLPKSKRDIVVRVFEYKQSAEARE